MAKKRASRPKAQSLPGMKDRGIAELEDLAEQYTDLGNQKKAAKAALLGSMKKHKKTHYAHGNIEITVAHGSDLVRVKVTPEPDPE